MVNRRPAPELIAARRREIKRRYEVHAKVGKRTRSMAAIRMAELSRIIDDRYGAGALPETDDSLSLARIVAHHLGGLSDPPRRIASWLLDRAPWIRGAERERLIAEVTGCPLKWSADKLAWKIGLTDADRTRLKVTTIGAVDVTREQRAARRRKHRADHARAVRAANRVTTI